MLFKKTKTLTTSRKEERRRYSRLPYAVQGKIILNKKESYPVSIKGLSPEGAGILLYLSPPEEKAEGIRKDGDGVFVKTIPCRNTIKIPSQFKIIIWIDEDNPIRNVHCELTNFDCDIEKRILFLGVKFTKISTLDKNRILSFTLQDQTEPIIVDEEKVLALC